MKRIILITILLLGIIRIPLHSQDLQAYLSYATYYSPEQGPYIETYLSIVGESVKWIKNENSKFVSTIEIIAIFKKDSVIENFKKYNLTSPEIDDTSNVKFNYIDLQRYLLPNGVYDFSVSLSDLNNLGIGKLENSSKVEIDYSADEIAFSGIQFVESFTKSSDFNVLTKSGYDIVPYIFSYYPSNVNRLKFYTEIYNTKAVFGSDYKYLLSAYVKSFESGLPSNDFYLTKKETSAEVNALLLEFDISFLPTGNYFLVTEVKDQNNNVVAANESFFQRSNPLITVSLSDVSDINTANSFVNNINNVDSLIEYINCLSPIATESEKRYAETQIANRDIKGLRQYFLYFWQIRNNAAPEQAWLEYKRNVEAVNKAFGTRIKKGYNTDRGRVYLKYGPPNSRHEVNYEPNAYPYEIWHYYTLSSNQRNKRFVFYNPNLVTGDYELLHSDAIGEVSDQFWLRRLNRDNMLYDFDQRDYNSHWGSRAKEYYNNPR